MTEILIADDDPAFRTMVGDLLGAAGYRVRAEPDGTHALAALERALPDAVLLDYRMGDPDGFEVCRRIKADPRTAPVPVLILTGEGSIEDRLGGFDAGADDYLAKPFDPRELLARVQALVRLARLGRDRNPTTGLPGGEAISGEIERRRAEGAPFAVCYFDLDHFKPFSDRFGFAVADAAIREAAAAVSDAVRGTDAFAGHVGGDDFVAVCALDEARGLAGDARRRFARKLAALLPPEAARTGRYRGVGRDGVPREFPVTRLSAAVVRVAPERWTSLEDLGRLVADVKHRAKAGEGDGVAEAELGA